MKKNIAKGGKAIKAARKKVEKKPNKKKEMNWDSD